MFAILLLLFVLGIFSLDGVPDDGSFVKRLLFSSDAAAMIQIQFSLYIMRATFVEVIIY